MAVWNRPNPQAGLQKKLGEMQQAASNNFAKPAPAAPTAKPAGVLKNHPGITVEQPHEIRHGKVNFWRPGGGFDQVMDGNELAAPTAPAATPPPISKSPAAMMDRGLSGMAAVKAKIAQPNAGLGVMGTLTAAMPPQGAPASPPPLSNPGSDPLMTKLGGAWQGGQPPSAPPAPAAPGAFDPMTSFITQKFGGRAGSGGGDPLMTKLQGFGQAPSAPPTTAPGMAGLWRGLMGGGIPSVGGPRPFTPPAVFPQHPLDVHSGGPVPPGVAGESETPRPGLGGQPGPRFKSRAHWQQWFDDPEAL